MTKVSVIIPAYNQGHFLGRAIQSVLEQTHQDFEIVVVDDGSTDDTRQVVEAFQDARLVYIYQDNQGLSAARNTGILATTAPYLTFLDSDDEFVKAKLALLSKVLDDDPKLGLVAGQALPVDEMGRKVGKIFDTPPPAEGIDLLTGNPLHVGSVMVRRSWQERAGLFDESLRSYEDWDMWLRLALLGCGMGWVAQPVSLYRFHQAQMTRMGRQMTTATFAVLDKFFANPDLPAGWQTRRANAYSKAHLRAAAQAYLGRDYERGKEHLSQSIHLDNSLKDNQSLGMVGLFRSWLDLPKTMDAVEFLEDVYRNLPEELETLQHNSRVYLADAAIQLGFEAYQNKDYKLARRNMKRAVRYQPKWLLNRGVLAVLSNTIFQRAQ